MERFVNKGRLATRKGVRHLKKKKAEKMLRKMQKNSFISFADEDIPVAAEILSSISEGNMTVAKARMILENLSKMIPKITYLK